MNARKRICSLLALLMVVVVIPAASAEKQLLRNPSFQNKAENMPVAWRPAIYSGKAELLGADIGRSDSACVTISSASGADASWSQTVQVKPFAKYHLSGWIKTENVKISGGLGVLLNIDGMDGLRTEPLTGSNEWRRVECEINTESINSLRINCLFGGWGLASGRAWYDDIELTLLAEMKPQSITRTLAIQIDPGQTSAPISKYIYGQFIEHLGRCIYGGIWAEMLEDRKFYFPVPADKEPWTILRSSARVLRASPWKISGPAGSIVMSTDHPFSGDHSPKITASGARVGIFQDELALLKGKEYTGRIVLRGDAAIGPVEVSLVWAEKKNGRRSVIIPQLDADYRTYDLKFETGTASENARLEITAAGWGSFVIGAVSLMPADNIEGFRRDTLKLLKQLDAPIYRWPGGNFVSGYDWRDGLGERDRRPTLTNPAWTGIEPNDVGMHEFIRFCQLINSEPMIAVNTGFGDAYSAAAEVEYANGAASTVMGAWRARNGSPEPFRVNWWCVGNEMWGDWQLGYMQLEHYVLKHNWVEGMMRRVDPTIKTVASGELGGGWSEGMLKNCSDQMNLLSEHFYCQERANLTAHARWIAEMIRSKTTAHRRFRETMPGLKEKNIGIAMDEWNYWYGPHVYGELGTRYFMKDALGIAAGLHEFYRNSDIVYMANYAQTVNVIGCIKTTKTSAFLDATALPLTLYRREFGTIPVAVNGGNENVDVSAALSADGKYLTIGLVNATYDRYQVSPAIKGVAGNGVIHGWRIANPDPLAYNDPGKPRIAIIDLPPAASLATITLPPVSITVLKIALK